MKKVELVFAVCQRYPECMRFGVHTSIAGGLSKAVNRAEDLGCQAFQIFVANPRGWKARVLTDTEVQAFRMARRLSGMRPVVVHLTYLPNLASSELSIRRKSLSALLQQVQNAHRIGAELFVLHPGSARGICREAAIANVAEALKQAVAATPEGPVLLLENMAGGGQTLGAEPEELAEIDRIVGVPDRVGVCFDTAHAMAAGHPIHEGQGMKRLRERFRRAFERDPIRLLHLNDLRSGFASCHDRHEHIGQGALGRDGIRRVLRTTGLRRLPVILETPVDRDGDDRRNLARARKLGR